MFILWVVFLDGIPGWLEGCAGRPGGGVLVGLSPVVVN